MIQQPNRKPVRAEAVEGRWLDHFDILGEKSGEVENLERGTLANLARGPIAQMMMIRLDAVHAPATKASIADTLMGCGTVSADLRYCLPRIRPRD